MGKASRDKGAAAEREVARILTHAGFPATRNARNGISAEDVAHAIPGYWIEVKRKERLDLWMCLAQADDGADGATGLEVIEPALIFRRNRSPWYVAIPLDNWLDLLKERQTDAD